MRFALEDPAFIDFGCGSGNSLKFAQGLMRAPGVGIDRSDAAVAAARSRGYEAHVGDLLDFDQRGCARAAFAIDSLPELAGRREFERAFINVVRAARDFTVIQHVSFDYDDMLAAAGQVAPGSFHKSIRYKPRISDYIQLVATHQKALNIVGLGIFGSGDPVATPIELPGLSATHFAPAPGTKMHRTLRVIIARKDVTRFHNALQRAATGDALVLWEAAP